MTQNISASQAHEWLKSGEAILIDVREPDEFRAEHIAYGISCPLGSLGDILKDLEIPTERKVIFQCLKGMRGQKACDIYACHDGKCDSHYNIEGGILEWKATGFPVILAGGASDDAGAPKLSIMRQVQLIVGLLIFAAVILGFAGVGLGFMLAGIFGGLLAFAGLTGWCGLAMVLHMMPWNK